MRLDPRNSWFFLVLPAIVVGNLAWWRIVEIVRGQGLSYPAWGGQSTILGHFRQVIRSEQDPELRARYRRLLWVVYASMASVGLWLIVLASSS